MTPCEGPEGEAGAMVPNSQMRGSDTETRGVSQWHDLKRMPLFLSKSVIEGPECC